MLKSKRMHNQIAIIHFKIRIRKERNFSTTRTFIIMFKKTYLCKGIQKKLQKSLLILYKELQNE